MFCVCERETETSVSFKSREKLVILFKASSERVVLRWVLWLDCMDYGRLHKRVAVVVVVLCTYTVKQWFPTFFVQSPILIFS